jgi:hypothetical protein
MLYKENRMRGGEAAEGNCESLSAKQKQANAHTHTPAEDKKRAPQHTP